MDSAIKLLEEARDLLGCACETTQHICRHCQLKARIDALLKTGGWGRVEFDNTPDGTTWNHHSTKNVGMISPIDGYRYILPLPPLPDERTES